MAFGRSEGFSQRKEWLSGVPKASHSEKNGFRESRRFLTTEKMAFGNPEGFFQHKERLSGRPDTTIIHPIYNSNFGK